MWNVMYRVRIIVQRTFHQQIQRRRVPVVHHVMQTMHGVDLGSRPPEQHVFVFQKRHSNLFHVKPKSHLFTRNAQRTTEEGVDLADFANLAEEGQVDGFASRRADRAHTSGSS